MFDSAKGGSALIAQLAVTIKPRYHFSAIADTFYERLPYRNHQILAEASTHPSRFVALASVGNVKKERVSSFVEVFSSLSQGRAKDSSVNPVSP